jgi:hypothetical protein
MKRSTAISGGILAALVIAAGTGWWFVHWTKKGPIPPEGGLWFPGRVLLEVPLFQQNDPRWAGDFLGPTSGTLGQEGCAVAAAAMTLRFHGVDTDPGRLNHFLQSIPGGYTERGWIYWEKAAEKDPELMNQLLPHYEDDASFALLDLNLIRGNPSIVRLRYPSGITHFVVVVGKEGYDYLILDPGSAGSRGVYPLREFGSGIEALRFYRRPSGP